MLANILKTNNKSEIKVRVSHLAKLCQIYKYQLVNSITEFNVIYDTFNDYSNELTISPKSSKILYKNECKECNHKYNVVDIQEQYNMMVNLIDEIITKFKINILVVFELYTDNKNLHCHSIMQPLSKHKMKEIKKHIENYYWLYSRSVVNIAPVSSMVNYKEYMKKDIEENMKNNIKPIYYNEEKITIRQLVSAERQQYLKLKKYMNPNPLDELQEHQLNCIYNPCKICDWIDAGTISRKKVELDDGSDSES